MQAVIAAGPNGSARTPAGPGRRRAGPSRHLVLLAGAVGLLAFCARLVIVVRGGGLFGLFGYDDGVYYSAAASFGFGRAPYRDFLFLHPPGVLLALAPFTLLGRLTSDPIGLAVARVAFMAVGALNAVLVTRLAARVGTVAAVVSGLFYAVWLPSMIVERTTLLEPLVALATLGGLVLLDPLRSKPSARRQVLAGFVLGCGACVKLWGAVPLVVIAVALLLTRGRHTALRLAAGAVAAGVLVCGPFLLAAGSPMLRMVLVDQARRGRARGSLLLRLADVTSVSRHVTVGRPASVTVVTVLVCALVVVAAVLSLRERRARVWVALLGSNLAVLLASPTYFTHYASFVGVPLALVVGAATAVRVREAAPGRSGHRTLLAVVAAVVLVGAQSVSTTFGVRYPAAALAAGVPPRGCVVADDNAALVELDVLSRDLRAGCPLEPDVTGKVYDLAAQRPPSAPVPENREDDPRWQAAAVAYLTTGEATAMVWGTSDGFNDQTRRTLLSLPLLAHSGRYSIFGR